MAVSYSSKKCESCGGSLEYIRAEKLWRCRYCGTEVVREETYDGLFTIKNVVRQTIVDAAYRRLDGARDNITECQKIDVNYVGTIIARLCYRLVCLITPGGCREEEVGGMYQRLKDDYGALCARDAGIGEDEESLYAFIGDADGAADAFALLVLVFDTLGDSRRAQWCYQLLELPKVYSKACNKDLLTYCMKQGEMDAARTIAANRGNIDAHTAMHTVLTKCPDGEAKRELIALLQQQGAYTAQDKDAVRSYLQGSDSCATKIALLRSGSDAHFLPDMDVLIAAVLEPATPEETEDALECICAEQLYDADLYTLLAYGISCGAEKALPVVRRIKASGHFVSLNGSMIQKVFLDMRKTAAERAALWKELSSCRMDKKALEIAAAEYLCRAADAPSDRRELMTLLLAQVEALPPSVVERYVLECRYDGEQKPEMIRCLFSLPRMHAPQFGGVLGRYLAVWPDEPALARRVMDALLNAGLPLSPNEISSFVCSKRVSAAETVEVLRRLEQNGSRPRADVLSTYLERCAADFSHELFVYLFDQGVTISDLALQNYLLVCRDEAAAKVRNAVALAQKQAAPLGASSCQIGHNGHSLCCNLAQAYLLQAPDAYELGCEMLTEMTRAARLTGEMTVDGSVVRFKKYIKESRAQLSATTVQLCEHFNLFSLF